MTRLLLIGGGGFAKEVAEIAELCGHDVVGYVASAPGLLDKPYLGLVEALVGARDRFDAVAVAFGIVDRKTAEARAGIIRWIEQQRLPSVPLVSPHATRSRGVRIEDGAIVAHGAILSVDCALGAFSIVNSGAIVGHDAVVGRNVTIAPAAFLGGGVSIGDDTLIGPGVMVLQSRKVGSRVIAGVGATVLRDVPDGTIVLPKASKVIGTKKAGKAGPSAEA
ncbi:PglD-related sugar-binding protein [Plastoroseomonas hellenica]|uniref:PglD-related sugar-binding protein n=1 Tax=Plastoroseomonas hellenica TaxID=2687306 RepID=UPI001BAC9BB2|nr:acetyltransferase [Plastoroseomonas hellenica]